MHNFEPPKISVLDFILKTAAGIGAGIGANLILLVLFLLTSSILQPVISDQSTADINPFIILTIIAVVFFTSLCANLIGPAFFGLIQDSKYTRRSTSAAHIFFLNIIILVFLLPVYLVSSTTSSDLTVSVAALHIIITTAASLIIFETISNPRYSLVGVYGTLFGTLVGMALNFILFEMTTGNWTIQIFAAMPIIWASIGLFSAITESLYQFVYNVWGNDFLASSADLGADYGVQPEEISSEEDTPKTQDVSGSDFLKKN